MSKLCSWQSVHVIGSLGGSTSEYYNFYNHNNTSIVFDISKHDEHMYNLNITVEFFPPLLRASWSINCQKIHLAKQIYHLLQFLTEYPSSTDYNFYRIHTISCHDTQASDLIVTTLRPAYYRF